MSRQAELRTDGLTHASSVIAVVRCKLAESGTVSFALVPLNDSALPYLPDAVHIAVPIVPLLLFPERSVTVVPVPSSKAKAAINSGMVASVVTVITFEYGP